MYLQLKPHLFATCCVAFSVTLVPNTPLSCRRHQQLAPYKLKCDKEPLNNKYVQLLDQTQLTPHFFWPFLPFCFETCMFFRIQTTFPYSPFIA